MLIGELNPFHLRTLHCKNKSNYSPPTVNSAFSVKKCVYLFYFRLASNACPAFDAGLRASTEDIHAEHESSSSMSIFVSMPKPCNMYTTSSVATLPDAPGEYGQPPSPLTLESTEATPCYNVEYKIKSKGLGHRRNGASEGERQRVRVSA